MNVWGPLVNAVATLLVGATPVLLAWLTYKLHQVEQNTNGNLSALREEVHRLRIVATQQDKDAAVLAATRPPDPAQDKPTLSRGA